MSGAQVIESLREYVMKAKEQNTTEHMDVDKGWMQGYDDACNEMLRLLTTLAALTGEDQPCRET